MLEQERLYTVLAEGLRYPLVTTISRQILVQFKIEIKIYFYNYAFVTSNLKIFYQETNAIFQQQYLEDIAYHDPL